MAKGKKKHTIIKYYFVTERNVELKPETLSSSQRTQNYHHHAAYVKYRTSNASTSSLEPAAMHQRIK